MIIERNEKSPGVIWFSGLYCIFTDMLCGRHMSLGMGSAGPIKRQEREDVTHQPQQIKGVR